MSGRIGGSVRPLNSETTAIAQKAPKLTAIYLRVSSRKQDTRNQEPDLKRWAAAQDAEVKFYREKQSGRSMDRPVWQKLWQDVEAGRIGQIVVWRIDRLGRTASGLTKLFDDLRERKVNLVSLKDSLDLSTPAGRLMANVLASVAAYEIEVRSEQVRAGQAIARENGKTWGGRKVGTRIKLTRDKEKVIRQLHRSGSSIVSIAQTVGLSRPTIYKVLSAPEA